MNNCSKCNQPMKVLFTSWYCDCKKIEEWIEPVGVLWDPNIWSSAVSWKSFQNITISNGQTFVSCNHDFNNPTLKCSGCGMDVSDFWQGLA